MSRTLPAIALQALLLLAPATQDRGCASEQQTKADEARPPGDPGANQGAQGRVNATKEEQESAGPATRKPNLP